MATRPLRAADHVMGIQCESSMANKRRASEARPAGSTRRKSSQVLAKSAAHQSRL
jgi:hypothetical protein